MRPALAETYRSLRGLGSRPGREEIVRALCGAGAHPRGPECCARIVRVMSELGLVEWPSGRLLEARRTDLERSATYRTCRERLALVERALRPELGHAPRVPAAVAS
jgi:hypothetical protein